jgi:hypothetical protein
MGCCYGFYVTVMLSQWMVHEALQQLLKLQVSNIPKTELRVDPINGRAREGPGLTPGADGLTQPSIHSSVGRIRSTWSTMGA